MRIKNAITEILSIAGLVLVFALTCSAAAPSVYIAQTASGSNSGADCADAHAVSFFNTSSNWGSGSTQIGAGTTVHLCGTFTFSSGGSGLTFQGGGAAGNPVTLLFESGAVLQSPNFAGGSNTVGAIVLSGASNVVIDGGTNGIVQNTANGSAMAHQSDSNAIYVVSSNNTEIKNLSILNMYVRATQNNQTQPAAIGINYFNTVSNNVLVHDNTITWTNTAFQYVYPANATSSNVQIYNNHISHTGTGLIFADGFTNAIINTVLIHDNDMDGGTDWWDPADDVHLNHMHIFAVASGDQINGLKIYNNNLHGNFGGGTLGTGHQTASIFVEGGPGVISGGQIFNNVVTQMSSGDFAAEGLIYTKSTSGMGIYNNTVVSTNGIGIHPSSGDSGAIIKNNVVSGVAYYIYVDGGSNISTSDYNTFFGGAAGATFFNGSTEYGSLANWKSATGFDAHSQVANPVLSATFALNPGSPAIGAGTNLTGLGTVALDSDMDEVARPSNGSWDMGAFSSAVNANAPAPPTGLQVSVN